MFAELELDFELNIDGALVARKSVPAARNKPAGARSRPFSGGNDEPADIAPEQLNSLTAAS